MGGTRIVYGRDHAKPRPDVSQIRPSMILLRPSKKAPQQGDMPVVPIKPEPAKAPTGPVAAK